MRLQEHFGDAGTAAEIAIDLERRAGVEQVRVATRTLPRVVQRSFPGEMEEGLEQTVRAVTIAQPGPQVYTPR